VNAGVYMSSSSECLIDRFENADRPVASER